MLRVTMGKSTERSAIIYVGIGAPELPVLSISLTEKAHGVEVAVEMADAVRPNLVFGRYHDRRTDVSKSVLRYDLQDAYEELLLHITEGDGRDRRHYLQIYKKDCTSMLYPDALQRESLALPDIVRSAFLLGLDEEHQD